MSRNIKDITAGNRVTCVMTYDDIKCIGNDVDHKRNH